MCTYHTAVRQPYGSYAGGATGAAESLEYRAPSALPLQEAYQGSSPCLNVCRQAQLCQFAGLWARAPALASGRNTLAPAMSLLLVARDLMFVQSIDTGLVRRYNVQLVFYARGEAGAAGALGDGDRLESRDVEAGTGRFEFPEDGEHWSTIWTGGACATSRFKPREELNICRSTRRRAVHSSRRPVASRRHRYQYTRAELRRTPTR